MLLYELSFSIIQHVLVTAENLYHKLVPKSMRNEVIQLLEYFHN